MNNTKTQRKIEGKYKIAYRIGSFFISMPMLLILGGIIGFAFYCFLGGTKKHPPASADIAFWVWVIGLPFVDVIKSSKRIKKINAAYDELASKSKSALARADYYNSAPYGGIAVDVKNKSIAVTAADTKFNVKDAFVFDASKILSYKAFQPERPIIDTTSMKAGQAHGATVKNEVARAKMIQETGIYFDLDDIHKPKVFAQMSFEEAESWLLIIKKLMNNTLETQNAPLLYPE